LTSISLTDRLLANGCKYSFLFSKFVFEIIEETHYFDKQLIIKQNTD